MCFSDIASFVEACSWSEGPDDHCSYERKFAVTRVPANLHCGSGDVDPLLPAACVLCTVRIMVMPELPGVYDECWSSETSIVPE